MGVSLEQKTFIFLICLPPFPVLQCREKILLWLFKSMVRFISWNWFLWCSCSSSTGYHMNIFPFSHISICWKMKMNQMNSTSRYYSQFEIRRSCLGVRLFYSWGLCCSTGMERVELGDPEVWNFLVWECFTSIHILR